MFFKRLKRKRRKKSKKTPPTTPLPKGDEKKEADIIRYDSGREKRCLEGEN